MATGSQRFVRQQVNKPPADFPELPTGVVTSTSPFTVLYNGTSLTGATIRRCASYTPTLNDIVVLARSGGNWFVIDKTV